MFNRSRSNRRCGRGRLAVAALEGLEGRLLLAAADWVGSWKFTGYVQEADEGFETSIHAEKRTLTVVETGDGRYQMTISGGDVEDHPIFDEIDGRLLAHSTRSDSEGDYCDAYWQLIPLGADVVLLTMAEAGFPDASMDTLCWGTGVGGVAVRGNVPVTNRPFEGVYDVTNWEFEAEAGYVDFNEPEHFSGQITHVHGNQYHAERLDEPADSGLDLTLTKGVLHYEYADEVDAFTTEYAAGQIVRGPRDTMYFLDGGVGYDNADGSIQWIWCSVALLEPQVGSQYRPDLVIDIGDIKGPELMVPGDRITVPLEITNAGLVAAQGKVRIELHAIPDPGAAPPPDGNWTMPLLVLEGQSLNLKPGARKVINAQVTIPADVEPGWYYLGAKVDATDAIAEEDEGNNAAVTDGPRQVDWLFGSFGDGGDPNRNISRLGTPAAGRKNVKLTLADPDGTLATFSLSGPGWGRVDVDWRMDVRGSTNKTNVTITTKSSGGLIDDGRLALNDISVGDPAAPAGLGKLKAGGVDVGADGADFYGGAAGIKLGDFHGGLWIGAGPGKVDVRLGSVRNADIDCDMPMKALAVEEWTVGGSIAAPGIGGISSAGDFFANLVVEHLDGATAASNLGKVDIKGHLQGASWTIDGSMGNLTVGGWIQPDGDVFTIRSGGAMGAVTAGAIEDTDFLAGMRPDEADEVFRFPADNSDFVSAASIKSVTVKGLKYEPATRFVRDCHFAAATVGAVKLLNVQFDNDGDPQQATPFGVWARSDGNPRTREIKSVAWRDLASPHDPTLNGTWPSSQLFGPPGSDLVISIL